MIHGMPIDILALTRIFNAAYMYTVHPICAASPSNREVIMMCAHWGQAQVTAAYHSWIFAILCNLKRLMSCW